MERSAAPPAPPRDPAAHTTPASEDRSPADGSGRLIDTHAAQLDAALDRWEQAQKEVLELVADRALQTATGPDLMGWTQRIEHLTNRAPIAGQQLINQMRTAGCQTDSPLGLYTSMTTFLAALLGITAGEASHRVRVAEAVAPVTDTTGHQRPIRHPKLAAAQHTGRVAPEDLHTAVKALREWERLEPHRDEITPESLDATEQKLAETLPVFNSTDLDKIIDQIDGHLNPDGILDDRDAQDAARGLTLRQITRGTHAGMYKIEGYLTAETGHKTDAVLAPLARHQHVTDHNGKVVQTDTRSITERRHDALDQVFERALHSDDLPAHGGLPASLILFAPTDALTPDDTGQEPDGDNPEGTAGTANSGDTGDGETATPRRPRIDLGNPRNQPSGRGAAFGWYDDGTRIPIDIIRSLADEAEITHIDTDQLTGEPLHLGRTQRIASKAITKALYLRDRGCTFPGCDRPPRWCQRHHIIAWIDGGPPDIENMCLLCAYHHHRFADHGWTAQLINGRTWWRPPKIIDPDRKPLLNIAHHDPPLLI